MTTAKPSTRYGAIAERAGGRLCSTELHYARGHDPEHFIEAENPDYSRHYWELDIVVEIEAPGSFDEIQRRMAFGGLVLANDDELLRRCFAQKCLIGEPDSHFQGSRRAPAKLRQAGDVEKLAWCAIRP